MTVSRGLRLVLLIVLASAIGWVLWPRPDLAIVVDRGGTATVVDHYGRRSALGDTVVVGGSGARRRVRVVNRDTVQHVLALFTVAAGTKMDYTVPPGTFGGYCSAHSASNVLTFVVR